MNERQAAEAYAYCCTIWGETPTEMALQGWMKALASADATQVDRRIQELIDTGHRFMPKVPELVAAPPMPDGAISRNGCTFMPGTGWVPCHPDDVDGVPRSEQLAELPALEAPPCSEAEARRRMAEMRSHIARGRAAMTGDPEVAGKVDALAAALRMAPDA